MRFRRMYLVVLLLCLLTAVSASAAQTVGTTNDLLQVLTAATETSLELQCPTEMLDRLLEDNGRELQRINVRAGIEDADISYSSRGLLLYENIIRSELPVFSAENENELSALFAECSNNGITGFTLLCPETLYKALTENNFMLLKQIEAASGMTENALGYIDALYELQYTEVRFNRAVRLLESFDDVYSYMNECILHGDTDMDLLCTEGLYQALLSPAVASPSGFTPLDDLKSQAGIMKSDVMLPDNNCMIQIRDIRLFPGYRLSLVSAGYYRSDGESYDGELLTAAWNILSGCSFKEPVQIAAYLNDCICEMTSYVIDPNTDTDDCALGPLLYGKANCSGYTDAYYLLCSLAGLEVCYQPGDSMTPVSAEAGHVWNAIKLDGKWYFIDVTWNDGLTGNKMTQTYFCIGNDLASRTHLWDRQISVDLASVTDPTLHGLNEYKINSQSDMNNVIQTVTTEKPECFGIVLAEEIGQTFSVDQILGDSYRSYRYTHPEDDANHIIFYDVVYR